MATAETVVVDIEVAAAASVVVVVVPVVKYKQTENCSKAEMC